MKIKVMPLLQKNKNQVAKAALEFDDCPGWQLIGFTICENKNGELFLLSPSIQTVETNGDKKTWYFWKPTTDDKNAQLDDLESKILDEYERIVGVKK